MRQVKTSACWSSPTRCRRTTAGARKTSSSRPARCAITFESRFQATPICSSRLADCRDRFLPGPFTPTETLMKSPATARLLRFAALATLVAAPALALKYAAPEHQLQVDPAIPSWKPGEVVSVPEESLDLVGADVMEEITPRRVKLYREASPN